MSDPFDLSKAQDSAERMALLAAQFYGGLIRSDVPGAVAERLTAAYLQVIAQLSLGMWRTAQPDREA